jgi:hypothetical protein
MLILAWGSRRVGWFVFSLKRAWRCFYVMPQQPYWAIQNIATTAILR